MIIEVSSKTLLARQPESALGKLAFKAFFAEMLLGAGGVLALTLLTGAPSKDMLFLTTLMLIATLLAATRIRWIALVNIALSAANFYLIFTEPYVTESLVYPKSPLGGGFGHFAGVVIICGIAFLSGGANLGAAIQNFRPGNPAMPRWLTAVWMLVLGLIVGGLFIGAVSQSSAPTTQTTLVNGVPAVHMSAGSFNQSSVSINKGQKLLLVDDTNAVHNLNSGSWQNSQPVTEQAAGAPAISNVQLAGGSVELGPFTTAGTYHIYCSLHTGMNLTVIVQ